MTSDVVVNSVFDMVDGTRLLVDLQQVNSIVKSFSGCLEPVEIADRVTTGLVEKFGCEFARIWLMEAEDRQMLRLVASSGLYTRTDGFFARVPVGAFKVGKIAQNQIPFLSNQLAAESWVLDRDWAIQHQIQGFAGYPLVVNGDPIGVLAVFSQQVMLPEFLEVLQSLCTATTIALEASLRYQQEKSVWQTLPPQLSPVVALSEQLAKILKTSQLTLVGTEQAISMPLHNLFLRTATVLSQLPCLFSRLTYDRNLLHQQISLEAAISGEQGSEAICASFASVQLESICLGGTLQLQSERNLVRILLNVTYSPIGCGDRVNIRCRSSVLQMAFSHLVDLAGLSVVPIDDPQLPLITDDRQLIHQAIDLLWIATDGTIPRQAKAKLDLSINPQQLRTAVATVLKGESWGIESAAEQPPPLSDREQEIMQLLTKGLRDRDIASQLLLSESTVKFHVHNILTKFKAKTRFQALYQAMKNGWIS